MEKSMPVFLTKSLRSCTSMLNEWKQLLEKCVDAATL